MTQNDSRNFKKRSSEKKKQKQVKNVVKKLTKNGKITMNKKDDRKAREEVTDLIYSEENYSGAQDWKYVLMCINRTTIFTKYYVDKDFLREFKDWLMEIRGLNFRGEYEGVQYKKLKHNLKELKKANIDIPVWTDIEY